MSSADSARLSAIVLDIAPLAVRSARRRRRIAVASGQTIATNGQPSSLRARCAAYMSIADMIGSGAGGPCS